MAYNLNNVTQYFLVDLHMLDFEIAIELSALRLLLETQEKSISDQRLRFDKIVENDFEYNSQESEEKAAYFEWMYGFSQSIIDEHERYQRYALISSIYSYFASRLKQICEFIADYFDAKSVLSTQTENELMLRYWNYLVKIILINPIKLEPSFTLLKQDKLLRNAITHQGGILDDNQMTKFHKRAGIEISGNTIHVMSNVYGNGLLSIITKFYSLLIKEIDQRYEAYLTEKNNIK